MSHDTQVLKQVINEAIFRPSAGYPAAVLLLVGASRRDGGRALQQAGWSVHSEVETDAEACRKAWGTRHLVIIPADPRCAGVVRRCRAWGAERWTCRPGTGVLAGQVVLERAWLHEDLITAANWPLAIEAALRGRR